MSAERDEETMDLLSAWLDAAPGNGIEIVSVPTGAGTTYVASVHRIDARRAASADSPHLGDLLQRLLTAALEEEESLERDEPPDPPA